MEFSSKLYLGPYTYIRLYTLVAAFRELYESQGLVTVREGVDVGNDVYLLSWPKGQRAQGLKGSSISNPFFQGLIRRGLPLRGQGDVQAARDSLG
jgi:hypothetical protein